MIKLPCNNDYFLPREFKTRRRIKNLFSPAGRILVLIPARFDFIGGWTDTPPYPYEEKSAVLNSTMALSTSAEITNVPPAITVEVSEGNANFIQNNLPVKRGEHLVIDKVLEYLCLDEPKFNLRVENSIPKGSGLGGSSLLGAAILSACLGYYEGAEEVTQNLKEIINGVLTVEQLMGSGGGWQDQIGGILPGLKLITTHPTKAGSYQIKYADNPEIISQLNNCSIVIDSKIQRKASFILHSIRRKIIEKDPSTLRVIKQIKNNAEIGFESINKGNLTEFSHLLSDSWDLVNSIESNSRIEIVDVIEKICGKDLIGRKIGGAGGGGFALVIFADQEKKKYYFKRLKERLPDCLIYYPFFGVNGASFFQNGKSIVIPKIEKL